MADHPDSSSHPAPNAVIGIIGDEILSGRVQDTNGYYIARRLHEIGVEVERMEVLPDRLETLVEFLRKRSPACDYLFTSGGIGPTHDDVTREAVALAFGKRLIAHPEAERIIRDYYGPHLNEARLAMALLPEGAELILNPRTGVPGCIVGNTYVLPGIPEILQAMFESIRPRIEGTGRKRIEIQTSAYEGEYAIQLAALCRLYPQIRVGSYPRLGDREVRSIITLTTSDVVAAEEMAAEVRDLLRGIER